jgi:sulfur carrier protein
VRSKATEPQKGLYYMNIIINGKTTIARDGMTVADLLAERSLDSNRVVVEVNENIVPRESFGGRSLCERDVVEILRFVGGG